MHIHAENDRHRKSYVLVRFPSGRSTKIKIEDIGKRLFLTKESAKKAVAERMGTNIDD